MTINYNYGKGEHRNWIIEETEFHPEYQGKFETIFSLANGYMGTRSVTEEPYAGQTRGTYIAGLFDEFPGEVTELPNLPDWTGMELYLQEEKMDLLSGSAQEYSRRIDLRNAQLVRDFIWTSPKGNKTKFIFKRFLSLSNLHAANMKVEIIPLNYSGKITLVSGINGQVTNSGVQHLLDSRVRQYSEETITLSTKTQESGVCITEAASFAFSQNGKFFVPDYTMKIDRRYIAFQFEFDCLQGEPLSCEKYVVIYTERDPEFSEGTSPEQVEEKALADLKEIKTQGYDAQFSEHVSVWQKAWERMDIKLDGPDFDQLGIRFSLYHMYQMTPFHDDRISIAAKGLAGEGYKGHVFWDAEIFNIPFHMYVFPEMARKLLTYRYHCIEGAKQKARANGYSGAMFPWESAATGEETTPMWWSVDLKTGEPIRIWTGEKEQHITADVVYSMWQYFQITGDTDFYENIFLEILFETSRFWVDRLEYNSKNDVYEINGVIGPDEYGENINNNGYTNFLVRWQLRKAADTVNYLKSANPELWDRVSAKIRYNEEESSLWASHADKLVFTIDPETKIISQYDGFSMQPEIDVTPFRGEVNSILKRYGWEEVVHSQVVKQADVVMLLYLMEKEFSREIRENNYNYYESRTVHDSSLSPAMHAIVSSRLGKTDQAYDYFQSSLEIDFGKKMNSSNSGIHAASLGGNWQAVVNGFAGVRVSEAGALSVNPHLPQQWNSLEFTMTFREFLLQVKISTTRMNIIRIDTIPDVLVLYSGGDEHHIKQNGAIEIEFT
ncbi:MAG: glycoside hydrolase family 65 protein [Spirochaetia bacterium]